MSRIADLVTPVKTDKTLEGEVWKVNVNATIVAGPDEELESVKAIIGEDQETMTPAGQNTYVTTMYVSEDPDSVQIVATFTHTEMKTAPIPYSGGSTENP